MAEHTPEDIEFMARLSAVAQDRDPDTMIFGWDLQTRYPIWQAAKHTNEAARILDHMQANGWKVTSRKSLYQPSPQYGANIGIRLHDAAPMTPKVP